MSLYDLDHSYSLEDGMEIDNFSSPSPSANSNELKRKRIDDDLDTLDFESKKGRWNNLTLKRGRPWGEEEFLHKQSSRLHATMPSSKRIHLETETAFDGVFQRALIWLMHMHSNNLPKSITGLANALSDICSLAYKVDSTAVLFHLAVNGIIGISSPSADMAFHPEAVMWVNARNPPTSLFGFRLMYQGDSGGRVSRDFEKVLLKSVRWVLTNRQFSGGRRMKMGSFQNCLNQMCVIRHSFDPKLLVDSLIDVNIITPQARPPFDLQYNMNIVDNLLERQPHHMAIALD